MDEMNFEEVCEYYKEDLLSTEEKIRESFGEVAPLISAVGGYIFSSGGKRVRPLLAILSSRLSGYNGEKARILACSIESIHTASLLHDDVVDGAELRRGKPPAHSLWGNHVAVLVGDFFYSNALRLANSLKNQRIMDVLSTATAKMAERELFQLSLIGNPNIREDEYMEIITGKTAVLMSAATLSGAILGGVTREKEEALKNFGLKLGMAFQITDDVLDYTAEEESFGKGLGKDLEEGKITLPLIYLLKEANSNEAEEVRTIINSNNLSSSALRYIVNLLNRYGAIEQSRKKASSLLNEAISELSIFEDSMEKRALLALSNHVLTRKK
jgi:octaprenyl-diphosphate synthase